MATQALSNDSYTVGWICALPLEMSAAKAMLDEDHGMPREQHRTDQNTYRLGRIGELHVAIACLPAGEYGIASAAVVAQHMLFTFGSIKIGLMVGIGGGIPCLKNDIRLGDVVVSKPQDTFGGVVQYDSGKVESGGEFHRTGQLNEPPKALLTAMSNLISEHEMKDNEIKDILEGVWKKFTKMRKDYSHQGVENDQVYAGDYDHKKGKETCISCDSTKLVERPSRGADPVIHYGLIASGHSVMKHGVTRDRLNRELGIICFEMEAAGLMNDFPCLVIRGICDYSDSHKNKAWQRYAAITAAAYTKELLLTMRRRDMVNTRSAAEGAGKLATLIRS
jgi:nucleoside phosphorylase